MWCSNSQLDSLIHGANLLGGLPVIFPLCVDAGCCDPSGMWERLAFASQQSSAVAWLTALRPPQLRRTHPYLSFSLKPCSLEWGDRSQSRWPSTHHISQVPVSALSLEDRRHMKLKDLGWLNSELEWSQLWRPGWITARERARYENSEVRTNLSYRVNIRLVWDTEWNLNKTEPWQREAWTDPAIPRNQGLNTRLG